MVKYFVENKTDLESKTKNQDNPLHLVCENKNVTLEIIKYLAIKGGDMNDRNNARKTPLSISSKNVSLVKKVKKKFGEKKSVEEVLKNIQNTTIPN